MPGRRAIPSRTTPKPRLGARSPVLSPRLVQRIVRAVIAGERREAVVQVTFLGPARMRQLNLRWKGHDRPTDVLAFALPHPDRALFGDVYICGAQARRQARDLGIAEREELIRLVVHGTLHVLGRDHPEGPGRTRSAMWRRQERYVRALA
ncbi:MAG: rRNA maturation RNase YbeY [Gemmatimonadota bacterium]|nr:rRNA maturation RNase YbeY [Gemmatimonadota bacterium]MDH5284068.1 rRNA maturation RNase YbeY [Gemmatimonadota bacterium]